MQFTRARAALPARTSRRPNGRSLLGIVVTGVLALASCGGGSDATDTTAAATAAATDSPAESTATTAANDATDASGTASTSTNDSVSDEAATTAGGGSDDATSEQDAPKSAIVSISPTATEMLFEIGAGDQVIAVDTLSNYPPEAIEKQTGIEAFTPNIEAISALEPDLVVSDGTNPDLLAQLDELGIDHLEAPAAKSLSDVYTQIEQIGAFTGHVGEAAELVSSMQTQIDEIVAAAPDGTGLSYYHELDNTFYSVTSDTFIGQVYGLFGMTNIADAADGADTGYPQLSPEYIVSADPDLIYLACGEYCGDTPATVAARPGWDQIAAVTNNGVIELDADIASRWGPRVVDLVQSVADSLNTVTTGANA